MPANEASLALTDAHREQVLALRQRVLRAVSLAWGLVTLDDLPGTHAQWRELAAEYLHAGQRAAAYEAHAYVAAYTASETGGLVQARVRPVEEYVGRSIDDSSDIQARLAGSLVAVRFALMVKREALAAGLVRAQQVTAMEVAHSARRALSDALVDTPETVGWRRVTAPRACTVCAAAATGAVIDPDELPDAHPWCRCVAEPQLRGLRDRHPRPTPEIER